MKKSLHPLTTILLTLLFVGFCIGSGKANNEIGTSPSEAGTKVLAEILPVQNGEFDSGTTGWILNDYTGSPGATISSVTGAGMSGTNALRVDVVNDNSTYWRLEVRQNLSFRFELGKTYRVTFMAKGETARGMDVSLWGNTNNVNYKLTAVNLTTSAQTYTIDYECTNSGVDSEATFALKFYLARGVISDVWLDNITVEDITGALTGVSISPSLLALNPGQTWQLSKTITPSNATNQNVTWSSDNTSVATVDNNGLVTAVALGTASITATTQDGGLTATSVVNITSAGSTSVQNGEFDSGTTGWILNDYTGSPGATISSVTGAGMSGTNALRVDVVNDNSTYWKLEVRQNLNFRFELGKTYRVTFMAKGETARGMDVSLWGNTNNINYKLTAINLTTSAQTYTIDYESTNAGINNEATFALKFYLARGVTSDVWLDNITIQDLSQVNVTGVTVSPTTLDLIPGQTSQLTNTIAPANATNQGVTWSSDNTAVATVDNSGLVTGVAVGTATITVTTADGSFTVQSVITVEGNAPVVANPIPDQTAIADDAYTYSFSSDTFSDADPGTTLTYSASLSNGNPLPSWLSFKSITRTFTGTPSSGDAGTLNVRVTASDGVLTAEDIFDLNVVTGFYRALNLNGAALAIDGNNWEASAGASNFSYSQTGGGTFSDQNVALIPSTDANRTTMIRSCIWGNTVSLDVNSVPNGNYDVFLYVWEDNNPVTFSVSVEGVEVVPYYNSGGAGIWSKLGPFRTSITDGNINVSANGSQAGLSGLEIHRASTGDVPVTDVDVSPSNAVLAVGQAYRLSSTITPTNATNPAITWSSSNPGIATVDNTGLVRAIATGAATITATSVDGSHTDTSTITVEPAGNNVLSNPEFDDGTNLWTVINYSGTPLNSIAVVQGAGLSGDNSLHIDIQNSHNGNWSYQVKSILGFRLEVGRVYRISFMAKAESARQISASLRGEGTQNVYWYSTANLTTTPQKFSFLYTNNNTAVDSDPDFSIAFPVAKGVISDAWLDNVRVEDVTDIVAVTNVSVAPTTLSLPIGQTGQLNPTFTPSNATNQNVEWRSSNSAVATVSNTGLVTAVSPGSSVVSVYTANGGYISTSSVTVTGVPVTDVSVSHPTLSLSPGNTFQLGSTITPTNATNQNLDWISDNPAIATVDNNGLVTAVANGSATITVTTVDGGFSDATTVTVGIAVTGVTILPLSLNLEIGQNGQLTATVSPSNATNQTVDWSSSNENIATVDLNGIVTAVGPGTATITVTTTDGSFTKQSEITVTGPATESSVLDQFAFQYKYDARRRMTHKKIPGAEWVYMVYDNRDRLVMTQDGNQRNKETPEWTFTKYDELNRPILTGIFKDTEATPRDQDAMQLAVNNFYIAADQENNPDEWFEVKGEIVHGYSNQSFPKLNVEEDYMTVTYYDDYSFQPLIGSAADDFDYDPNQLTAANSELGQRANEFSSVNGYVTGTKIKKLGTNEFLWSVNYYDDRYRVIQIISQNHKAGLDKLTNVYDFTGKVLRTRKHHATTNPSPLEMTTTREYAYDHVGRILQTVHQTGTDDPITIARNEYNELGQLVTKKLHSEDGENFMQHEDYRYNIRGWLTRINNADLNNSDGGPWDYFGMELGYENSLDIGNFTPQYNGNISSTKWSSSLGLSSNPGVPTERAYQFEYDPLNRMTKAKHSIKLGAWSSTTAFHESVAYDLNGNIQKLYRTDSKASLVDWLVYDYGTGSGKGNRLKSVADNGISTTSFIDNNLSGVDYVYDDNGNVIQDRNKEIESIKYSNYLNQKEEITKKTGEKIKYIYNADGIKLAEEIYTSGTQVPAKRTDYIGEFVYENDTLKFVQHDEGKIIIPKPGSADPSVEYQYQIKDHLNNTRLTFTSKRKTDEFKATMEDTGLADYTNPRVQEMAIFGNLFESEILNVNQWLNHTSNEIGNSVYLDGSEDKTVGVYTMLKVYPGDTVKMEVFGKYENKSDYGTMPIAAILAELITPIQSVTSAIEGANLVTTSLTNALTPFLTEKGSDDTRPAVYLNYILFDKNLSVVDLGFDRMSLQGLIHCRKIPSILIKWS